MDHVDSPNDLTIQQWGRMGFALAVQMLGSREDAADAVQDSLYQLVRKGRALDARSGEGRSWFLKVVRNRCIDMIRRRGRQAVEVAELEHVVAADRPGPGEEAENREESERLKVELMSMTETSREIVLLRDFHDLSYGEIAEVLSIPPGTVMSRLHRARKELRRRMEAPAT